MTVIQVYDIPTLHSRDDYASALPANTKLIIYVTTIVGGTIVLTLIGFLLFKRHRRLQATRKQRLLDELAATSQPRKRSPRRQAHFMTSQPEVSMVQDSKPSSWYEGSPANPLPVALTDRFRRKDAYVKATLGEAFPMHLRSLSVEERSALLSDPDVISPDSRLGAPTLPPLAYVSRSPLLGQSYSTRNEDSTGEQSERSLSSIRTSKLRWSTKAENHKPMLKIQTPKQTERWSWTNSSAPATPRMYAPTLYSHYSKASATRFRMAVNWVRTRGERVTSGEAPSASGPRVILPKAGVLKNQASKPNLAPNKLVKKNSTRTTSGLPDVEKGGTL